MGVALEAIVEKTYFEYRLKDSVSSFMRSYRDSIISLGARPVLPMVVAPEAIAEYFWV
jgi:hypothetical protein